MVCPQRSKGIPDTKLLVSNPAVTAEPSQLGLLPATPLMVNDWTGTPTGGRPGGGLSAMLMGSPVTGPPPPTTNDGSMSPQKQRPICGQSKVIT